MVVQSLTGKLALVTGGASGIGKSTCLQLAQDGATVIVTDLSINKCLAVKNKLDNQHLPHRALVLDITCTKSINAAVKDIMNKYKKPPTIVIHSAGIGEALGIASTELSDELWDKQIEVNLKGTFLINKTFAKLMKDASMHGSIVNLSSLAREGYPRGLHYAAAKAGVIGITATMAKEFGRYGIRCNAVAPGMIKTPMLDLVPPRIVEAFRTACALKRIGRAEEVASVCVFLGSDASSYINGETVSVTGGML